MKITPDSNLKYCNNINTNINRQTNYIDKYSNVKNFDEILINKGRDIPEDKIDEAKVKSIESRGGKRDGRITKK